MLPIMMRVELTFFEEAHDLLGFTRANHRTQTHSRGIALRHHHLQTTRNYAQHVILFSPAVQHSVTNLLDQPNTVVRIDNFVAYLIVHDAFSPDAISILGKLRQNSKAIPNKIMGLSRNEGSNWPSICSAFPASLRSLAHLVSCARIPANAHPSP